MHRIYRHFVTLRHQWTLMLLFGIFCWALLLSGCSSKNSNIPEPPPITPGKVNFTVEWPSDNLSVQSLLIEIPGIEGQPDAVVLNRDEGTYRFSTVPVGKHRYSLSAYSALDAAGSILGKMDSWLEVTSSANLTITVNPDVSANVITMIIRVPISSTSMMLYDKIQLKAEAYDGKGRLLLLPDDPFDWQVEPATIATISNQGLLEAKAVGNATISVTEKRSMRSKLLTLPIAVLKKNNPVDGAEMIYIPACSYILGDSSMNASLGDGGNCPETEVHLSGYYIYKNEVTVRQFKAFCDRDLSDRYVMPTSPWLHHNWDELLDHPMVNVTWWDALAYAQWVGGTLPSEAQWERPAQGAPGVGTPYPWGKEEPFPDDLISLLCRYDGNADKGPITGVSTAPVAYYHDGVSPEGIYDMAGNAWEWCMDRFYNGAYAAMQGKTDPINDIDVDGMQTRSIRGGAFNSIAYYCRSSFRFYAYPDFGYNYITFRVIVPAPNEGRVRGTITRRPY